MSEPIKQSTEMVIVRKELSGMEREFQKVLPPDVTPDRFIRVILTGVQQNADLLRANRQSLILACMRCAQDGLIPDSREAALVAYGQDVQYLPMIRGIVKTAYKGGEILKWVFRVVHKKDLFKIQYGDEERIIHEPALEDEGEFSSVYSVATLKSGEISRDWMNKAAVDRIRAMSRMKNGGPWKDHYEEMAKKTVGHRHAKTLPMSPQLESVLEALESHYDIKPTLPAPQATPDWLPGVEPKVTAEEFVKRLRGSQGASDAVAQMLQQFKERPEWHKYAQQVSLAAANADIPIPPAGNNPETVVLDETEKFPFEKEGK